MAVQQKSQVAGVEFSIPWSGAVRSCLPCIAIHITVVTKRGPFLGTKHMKMT